MENNQTTTKSKPTIYIDASALKESSCSRRLFYTIFYGYKSKSWQSNYQAGYGTSVHRPLELWYSKPSEERTKELEQTCIALATKTYEPYTSYISTKATEFRTPIHLVKTMESYFKTYPAEFDDLKPVKGVLPESKWIYPYYSCDKFDLILAGTIDLFAEYFGELCFVDHKSTSARPENYFAEYDLSIQMMLYAYYVEKVIGRRIPCVINGIFLKSWTKCAREIDIFDGVKLERSQKINYTDQQMKEFEKWLHSKLNEVIKWLTMYFNREGIFWFAENQDSPSIVTTPNFASCIGRFGPCNYFNVCSKSPEFQDRILATMNREPYEPLRFGE